MSSSDTEQDDQFESGDGQNLNTEFVPKDGASYSSDDDNSSDNDDDLNIEQQKEEAMALNNTWGKFKKNFYGRNKADDDFSITSDDQDELE